MCVEHCCLFVVTSRKLWSQNYVKFTSYILFTSVQLFVSAMVLCWVTDSDPRRMPVFDKSPALSSTRSRVDGYLEAPSQSILQTMRGRPLHPSLQVQTALSGRAAGRSCTARRTSPWTGPSGPSFAPIRLPSLHPPRWLLPPRMIELRVATTTTPMAEVKKGKGNHGRL